MPRFLVGASAAIFDENGRVLLFQHTYRRKYPWGMPGGWLKAGEDAAAAVVREVYEESGFQVQAVRPLVIGGCKQEHRIDLIFLCTLQSGNFRPSDEVSEARFFAPEELPAILDPRHYNEIVQVLAQRDWPESPLPDEVSGV
ncbi:MAG: NUDIX hydrolase [Anaerolineae bacterium]|nr:NUDIX hydrolase [Anaerolineae bacterium]